VGIGQTVLFTKDAQPVRRGDVVLLTFRDGYDAISRVVGLPGDTVACPANGRGGCDAVTVNGGALDETWLDAATSPFAAVSVGPGEVFVLGDARDAASDSRFVGAQRLSDIKGAAIGRLEDGKLTRLPGTPDRPVPDGENIVDPAGPVPPAVAR
jgi:signal peptidase I